MTMRLLVLEPNIIFTARVDQTSFEYPIAEVTYDDGTTFGSDVLEGHTVMFGTSAGNDDLGRQRLRSGSTIDASGTLKFGRSSLGVMDGEVKLQNDAYITVYESRSVWMKAPFIDDDGVIYKDHDIAYSDQNENTPPVANAGVGVAASLSGGTRKAFDFDAGNSFATAAGATITDYLWDVGSGGMVTAGTLTSQQLTVSYLPGFRYISLTVTDSNGETHTAYAPVYVRDPNSDDTIQTFLIDEHRITPEGQEIAFNILDDIPADTYPNGTVVMLWEGEPSSNSDRSHMRFVGWHMTDPAQITAERTGTLKGTVLRCGDVGAMLRRLPGFPVEIIGAASPENWGQMTSPNMDKYLHFLLQWHSTALELADYTDSGTGSSYPFVILGSDGESLWEQVQSKAKALVPDYVLTCNRFGQLNVLPDPVLQDSGDRTSTVQKALLESDISDISWEAQNFPRIHWLHGEAILANASAISAIFCIAPGTAPGQGLSEQPSGEQLAQSQADLNACEGHRYARLNAPNSYFTITLAGSDDFYIDPADMTWVSVRLASKFAAQRGLTLDSERGLPRELNITYDAQRTGAIKTIELIWEQETEGEPAVTFEYDAEDFPPPPEIPPPDDDDYDPNPGPGGDGEGTLYIMTGDTLGRTRDASADSPAYEDITPGGVTALWDFVLDPWSPLDTGYLVAIEGVYKSTNLDQETPTWSQVLSAAQILSGSGGANLRNNFKIVAAITVQDYLWLSYTVDSYQSWIARSTDGGASWTHHHIKTSGQNISNDTGCFDVVPHGTPGNHILYKADGDSFGKIYRSNDDGVTWILTKNFPGGPDFDGGSCLHCPYDGNADGRVLYIAWDNGAHKSTDGGVTSERIHGISGSSVKRTGIETFTGDADTVVFWRNDNTMWVSTDGASSFSERAATGLSGNIQGTGGFPTEEDHYYALTDEGIFLSSNGGQSFQDKTGDWAFGFTFPGDRMGVIVPVWVKE